MRRPLAEHLDAITQLDPDNPDPLIIRKLRITWTALECELLPHSLKAYSVPEVSKILSIPKSTLYECVRNGDIPAIHAAKSLVRISGSWVWKQFDKVDNMSYPPQDEASRVEEPSKVPRIVSTRDGGTARNKLATVRPARKRRKQDQQNAIDSSIDYRAVLTEAAEKVR